MAIAQEYKSKNPGQPEAPVTDSGTSVTMNLPNSGN